MFVDSSKLSKQTNKNNDNIFSGSEGDVRTRGQANHNEAAANYGLSLL